MKVRQVSLSLIQCYAPTNDSDDNTKDTFYDQLQAEMEAAPCHDLLNVMGDLNAKVSITTLIMTEQWEGKNVAQ